MNNLKDMLCYSVGPIDRVEGAGKEWRLELDTWLPQLGVKHLNPHNKPFKGPSESDEDRQKVNELKKIKAFERIKQIYGNIRKVDLRCVDLSSFLIARIDVDVHMCGTYEEITTANRQKKPILCHVVQGVEHTPSWLIYQLPEWSFFDSMDEIKRYLNGVNTADHYWLDERWTIFK